MASPANSAELSTGNSLGFSQNGNHFVFEEYGTQDGTGAPYANLYAIDIARDRWVKGTPIRLKGTEEEAIAIEKTLAEDGITDTMGIIAGYRAATDAKRREALDKAHPILLKLGRLIPADQRAHNPPWEFTGDATRVRFSSLDYNNLVNSNVSGKVWRLELAEHSFAATEACFGLYDRMKGFTLVLINEKTGVEIHLNDDTRVPKSRSCPQKYTIEQVLTFPRGGEAFSLAVMVRFSRPGFEGPDGRLLAVTAIVSP